MIKSERPAAATGSCSPSERMIRSASCVSRRVRRDSTTKRKRRRSVKLIRKEEGNRERQDERRKGNETKACIKMTECKHQYVTSGGAGRPTHADSYRLID